MSKLKIIATADWHAGILTDDVNGSRLAELSAAVGKMAAEKPDLLLIAGDVFHTNHPAVATVLAVRDMLSQFSTALLIPGNHDFNFSGRSPVALVTGWDDGGFGDDEGFEVVCFEKAFMRGVCGAYVLCVPPAATPEAMLDGVTRGDMAKADIILGHWSPPGMDFGIEGTFFSPAAIPPAADLPDGKLVILGHVHTASIDKMGGRWLVPGSPQRLDFGDDPDGEKGYWRITWDTDERHADKIEFVPVEARRYLTLESVEAVRTADVAGAVVRVQIQGRPDVNAAELENHLRNAGAHVVRPIEIIREARRPRVELAAEAMTPAGAAKKYCEIHGKPPEVVDAAVGLLEGGNAGD